MSSTIELRLCLMIGWDEIEAIRQAVGKCVEAAYGSAELRDSLAMVSAELLENAVKYGKPGVPIGFALEENPDGVHVVVTNPVADGACECEKLLESLAWLAGFDDSRAAYAAALERAYQDSGAGGLGLARIRHEGGCSLRCDTSTRGIVSVSARRRRKPQKSRSDERASA